MGFSNGVTLADHFLSLGFRACRIYWFRECLLPLPLLVSVFFCKFPLAFLVLDRYF